MNRNIVFPNIDFADSEFSSITISEKQNYARITLISWDNRELEITLVNPILCSYQLGDVVANFYEALEPTKILEKAIAENYETPPPTHPFKLFQLVDVQDFSFVEIVAESASIIKRSVEPA